VVALTHHASLTFGSGVVRWKPSAPIASTKQNPGVGLQASRTCCRQPELFGFMTK
jgi:hypothetical protein